MAEAAKKKISMIPAKAQYDRDIKLTEKKLRVAAYCRVSTELEQQESSYEAQVEYYTEKIEENPNWKNAGIYAEMKIAKLIQFESLNTLKTGRNKGFLAYPMMPGSPLSLQ